MISGCYRYPSCYCGNCPSCDCTPKEPEPITTFGYTHNIRLFNDYAELTTEEIIEDYYVEVFLLQIRNDNHKNETDINGSLCIEHKFKEVDIRDLLLMPIPKGYSIQSMGYQVDCWQLPTIKYLNEVRYELMIEQDINQNQTVKLSIWE